MGVDTAVTRESSVTLDQLYLDHIDGAVRYELEPRPDIASDRAPMAPSNLAS